jgi:hypothetical protein
MTFDRFQEPEDCMPRADSEGDPVNCLECEETGCDYWEEIHSRYETEKWKELQNVDS